MAVASLGSAIRSYNFQYLIGFFTSPPKAKRNHSQIRTLGNSQISLVNWYIIKLVHYPAQPFSIFAFKGYTDDVHTRK